WASGVTYLSSRMAREAESQSADVYQKVYAAPRPELFFKAAGWRTVGHGQPIRVRGDSHWNVPEPELVLLLDADGAIRGYSVGNDVSSRSIEGENPLYLPQAKVYDGSCAIGPALRLCPAAAPRLRRLRRARPGAPPVPARGHARPGDRPADPARRRGRLLRPDPHLADQARPGRAGRLPVPRTVLPVRRLPVHRHRHRAGRILHPAVRRRGTHRDRRPGPGEPRAMSKSNLQPILLDGRWVAANAPTGSFRAFDPSQKLEIDSHDFPVSGWEDLDAMLEAGKRAAAELARLPGERIAQFLEAFAAGIEARAEALIESAHRETGLPVEPRLRKAELPRTTGQL